MTSKLNQIHAYEQKGISIYLGVAVQFEKQEYLYSYSNRFHIVQQALAQATCGCQFRLAGEKVSMPILYFRSCQHTLTPTADVILCMLHKKDTHSSNVIHPPLLDDDLANKYISFGLELRDGIRDRSLVHVARATTRPQVVCLELPSSCACPPTLPIKSAHIVRSSHPFDYFFAHQTHPPLP